MRDILRKYQPERIEDLSALNALYRPGPIQGGMIDDFIERKHGRKQVIYDLPELKEMLEETYGVIVYQEQVMQISNRMAGYSLGDADILRRAMGKKKPEEMAKQRERFIKGALEGGFHAEEDREDFRSDGAVRRLRLQQVPLGGLRLSGVRYRVPESALSRSSFMAALLTSETGNAAKWSSTSTNAAKWASRAAAGRQRQRSQTSRRTPVRRSASACAR